MYDIISKTEETVTAVCSRSGNSLNDSLGCALMEGLLLRWTTMLCCCAKARKRSPEPSLSSRLSSVITFTCVNIVRPLGFIGGTAGFRKKTCRRPAETSAGSVLEFVTLRLWCCRGCWSRMSLWIKRSFCHEREKKMQFQVLVSQQLLWFDSWPFGVYFSCQSHR